MKEKICLALDVSTRREALELVRSLRELSGMFKVGMQLFTAEGPSLVKEIVEAHGGTVRVRSEPGQGTEFTMVLPCHES